MWGLRVQVDELRLALAKIVVLAKNANYHESGAALEEIVKTAWAALDKRA